MPQTVHSRMLYEYMVKKGYPARFAELVSQELSTEYTSHRMMGYLSHFNVLPLEEVADEMMSILSDRNKFAEKKILENTNRKINSLYNDGLED